jgi:hypothetical protein
VRRVTLALLLLSTACRRDAATGGGPAASASPAGGSAGREVPGHPSGVSDDELVAFTRWQRDYIELFSRHRAEIDAVGADDPAAALRDRQAFEAQVAAVVARQMPVMRALLAERPLQDDRSELVTEAVGGIFHYQFLPGGRYNLVVGRDEVRLDAARRRFGKEAVDDIVAREPLVLEALQAR